MKKYIQKLHEIVLITLFLLIGQESLAATEYVQAHKVFLSFNSGYFETAEQAAQATAKDLCKNQTYAKDCQVSYQNDAWNSSFSTWEWRGTQQYTYFDPTTIPPTERPVPPAPFGGAITFQCPVGWSGGNSETLKGICYRTDRSISNCDVCDKKNPVPAVNGSTILSNGITQEIETDYSNFSGTLSFSRTYRSDERTWSHNYDISAVNFNSHPSSSSSNLCIKITSSYIGKEVCLPFLGVYTSGARSTNSFAIRRGNGRVVYFGSDTDFLPEKDINDRIKYSFDPSGESNGIVVYNAQSGASEFYGSNDKISKSISRNGEVTNFVYSNINTPKEIAPVPDLLISVIDSFNSALNFTYDTSKNMSSMTTPNGDVYKYNYDVSGKLLSVTYPDQNRRDFIYGEKAKTGGIEQPSALTTIKDQNDVQISSFIYDSEGRVAINEVVNGNANNAISYPYPNQQTVVTEPLGAKKTYTFTKILGVIKSSGVSQPAPSGTGSVSTSLGYDINGNINSITKFDGSRTAYVYDLNRNLEISRIEAADTALARTITTEWHPTLRLPTRIAEPKLLTVKTYDVMGNVLTKTLRATSDVNGSQGFNATLQGAPRVWIYTYNQRGQVLTEKGPRTDVNETISYAYDEKGNLSSVTNALGHTISFSHYDANGRVGHMTDANGLVTELTYTVRGWLASKTVGGEITSFKYNSLGQLTQMILPDSSTVDYTYDTAQRLTGVADSLGNSVTYTLDAMGNRVNEQVKDAGGTLARQTSSVFDKLGQLKQQTGGAK
jgi:YD repeat-containing protein